ncbi:MAG: glycosyltransferase, partial [Boseongicola sp.]
MSNCSALWPSTVRSPHDPPSADHVTILLATFNGAAHVNEQLESYCNQTHRNWSLLVSDDGSSDETCSIIRKFARRNSKRQVTLLRGPGNGSASNFLSLLRAAG